MLELLLITTCLTTEPTCGHLTKAYYAARPSVARNLKRIKNRTVAYTGTWILYAAPAVALTHNGGVAQFRIARHFNLQIAPDRNTLLFDIEF